MDLLSLLRRNLWKAWFVLKLACWFACPPFSNQTNVTSPLAHFLALDSLVSETSTSATGQVHQSIMDDSQMTHSAVQRLEFGHVFESLTQDGTQQGRDYQAYAHHLARACWYGVRIMLRQTSPEAEDIFDFILALHNTLDGDWYSLCNNGVARQDIDAWLEFSALFLSGVGNYYARQTSQFTRSSSDGAP